MVELTQGTTLLVYTTNDVISYELHWKYHEDLLMCVALLKESNKYMLIILRVLHT